MKSGDIVKFKDVVDPGDTSIRMELLEDPMCGRVLVKTLVDMHIQPTYIYMVDDLEVVDESSCSL